MVVLILLLIVLSVGGFAYIRRIKKELPAEEDAQTLIWEAAAVTADFLEAGQAVYELSEGNYLGTIALRFHPRKHNRAGYQITMYDTGNLLKAYEDYRRSHPEQNREDFHALEIFLEAYGGCYDPERNALVYVTKHSTGFEAAREGEAELRNRIALHPLAEMESLVCIHTKYVGKS